MTIDGAKSLVLTGLESSAGESSVINSSEALEMTQTSADSIMEKIIAEIKGTMEIFDNFFGVGNIGLLKSLTTQLYFYKWAFVEYWRGLTQRYPLNVKFQGNTF